MPDMNVHRRPFGITASGTAVTRYELTAADGSGVSVLGFGGVVLEVRVPDRDGRLANVALGFGTVADYETNDAYVGAVVGLYANRIAGATFTLDGRPLRLVANEGANHLHGGRADDREPDAPRLLESGGRGRG